MLCIWSYFFLFLFVTVKLLALLRRVRLRYPTSGAPDLATARDRVVLPIGGLAVGSVGSTNPKIKSGAGGHGRRAQPNPISFPAYAHVHKSSTPSIDSQLHKNSPTSNPAFGKCPANQVGIKKV